MKPKLLCAVCIVLLSACGKSGQENAVPPVAPAASQTTSSSPPERGSAIRPDALRINGLYVGMDIQDVPNAMMMILADRQLAGFGFTDALKARDGTQCVLMYSKAFLQAIETRMRDRYGEARGAGKVNEELLTSCFNSDGVLSVMSGADNRVNRIEFNDVRDLFDAKGLSPAEFIKKISAEYHLPEMKPNELQNVWSTVSPDGVRVEVDAKEVLGIPMARLYMNHVAP